VALQDLHGASWRDSFNEATSLTPVSGQHLVEHVVNSDRTKKSARVIAHANGHQFVCSKTFCHFAV
jgi:hypothetical protein